MRWVSISVLTALALSAPAPVAHAQGTASRTTIVLYGANWCAPCMGELRDMPRLAAAVAPDRLVLVWTDGGLEPARFAALPNVHVARDAEARELTALAGDARTGLPYGLIRDDRGRICADWRRRLLLQDVARLRNGCAAR